MTIESVVAALLHKYVYGPVPVSIVTLAFPLLLPQVAAVVVVDNVMEEDVFSVVVAEAVHPPAPVTVTEYVPAPMFEIFCVVAPLLQL